MKALRATKVDTVRGPVSFDEYGNVVGNVYIRKVERKEGRLVNSVIKTYPNVSQFWTYDPKEFLAEPGVFARLAAGEESGALNRRARRSGMAAAPRDAVLDHSDV